MNLSQRPRVLLFANLLLFVVITVIDQSLKRWALGLDAPAEVLGLTFFPFENRGVFGGYLAELDPWIVRIFFSVLFGFLAFGGLLVVHFLKHRRVPWLKWGILVYLAGLLGNVWDRMTRGAVVDYLVLPGLGDEGMAFNFADLVVVVGFLLIAIAIFREAHALWFDRNQRRGYWVEPRFQWTFGWMLTFVGFAHFFVIGVYSYVFLKVFIGGERLLSPIDAERVIVDYLVGLFILETGALILTFAVSVIFSHRFVGAIIAVERYLERRAHAAPATAPAEPLRLRRSDFFQERLERIARLAVGDRGGASSDQKPRE